VVLPNTDVTSLSSDPYVLYELAVLSPVTGEPIAVTMFYAEANQETPVQPGHVDAHCRRMAGRNHAVLSILAPPVLTRLQARATTASRVVAEYNPR